VIEEREVEIEVCIYRSAIATIATGITSDEGTVVIEGVIKPGTVRL
jgi:hypothetical protein